MKILAIESATKYLSVAILEENKIIAESFSDNMKTHSETLLPMIEEVRSDAGINLSDIDAIAVSNGPGSFTGLRIGVTTAKGLGLALDKPVLAVPTLEAMAYNFDGEDALICPMIDARRNQIYTGIYKFEGGALVKVMAQCALAIDELCEDLTKAANTNADTLTTISIDNSESTFVKIICLGDGADLHKEKLIEALGDKVHFAEGEKNYPIASSVARLGKVVYDAGEAMSADDVLPTYLRQSQAEREYAKVTLLGKQIVSTTLDADNEGKVFLSEDKDADIKAIAHLEEKVFGDSAWNESMVASHFTNTCNGALLARRGDTLAGYVMFQKIAGEGEIFRIAVDESYRRAGIARRLISILMQDSETDTWMLEVRCANKPAIALYEAVGFQRERVVQDYYINPIDDALNMKKVIREENN